jgi:taurine dioxygenase
MTQPSSSVPALSPVAAATVEGVGASIKALRPMGAVVEGLDLSASAPPPAAVVKALEQVMAERGFVVFRSDKALAAQDFLQASCWWGGKMLHSTHGVHPATPGGNQHLFRLSNDTGQGIVGVGPQWHNDGSFNLDTFSHAGYHMVRRPERGGGTYFAHQAAAFDALTPAQQAYWRRLSSVNATSGVVHPVVHVHPISKRECIWLHLGMTGAVIEKAPDMDAFCLLDANELRQLCREYNDVLNAGLNSGYAIAFEYEENDCLFIDNLSVAHRAAPEAHLPPEQQGLRIMHRSTIKGVHDLKPSFGLPAHLNIYGPSPLGEGVWQAGGLGFRWDDDIPMQN